ncbi:hypothetical protein E3T55_01690 [Cryobacterium frigoriphilum]|uniref:Asparagine synthase n=1 Tax=Cryobacterium frigoriphilum TaxID=1259150 RepID=A0A4R9AAT6_9MICO|nr:hypothetical protein [Cryobacterium frigoriphilum]TFD55160.1 hypothetical protein E3T55_01690 [Cryobacterium frigoriphilum]
MVWDWIRRVRGIGAESTDDTSGTGVLSEDRIVDEGLLISLSAVRMAVKNHILVGALREHLDFEGADYSATARHELDVLARQNEEYGVRVTEMRDELVKARWKLELTRDQRADVKQFALRRRVHDRLTAELDAVSQDDAQVSTIVEKAREDASHEFAQALAAKLIRQNVDGTEPDYERKLAERRSAFVRIDLAKLLAYDNEY